MHFNYIMLKLHKHKNNNIKNYGQILNEQSIGWLTYNITVFY